MILRQKSTISYHFFYFFKRIANISATFFQSCSVGVAFGIKYTVDPERICRFKIVQRVAYHYAFLYVGDARLFKANVEKSLVRLVEADPLRNENVLKIWGDARSLNSLILNGGGAVGSAVKLVILRKLLQKADIIVDRITKLLVHMFLLKLPNTSFTFWKLAKVSG